MAPSSWPRWRSTRSPRGALDRVEPTRNTRQDLGGAITPALVAAVVLDASTTRARSAGA
jgi:hypothetical protein